MQPPLEVAVWNVKGALSDQLRAIATATKLIESQSDVICVPDAWHLDSDASIPTGRKMLVSPRDFERAGYRPLLGTFREDRPDDNFATYGFMTLVRDSLPVERIEEVRLNERPAHIISTELGGTCLTLVSAYLNDQNETNRIQQTLTLFEDLSDRDPSTPSIVMGDFNAMHRSELLVAKCLQAPLLRTAFQQLTIANNTMPRLVDMADGATMALFSAKGYRDVDTTRRPTTPSRFPLFQLDHILVRDPHDTISVSSVGHEADTSLSDHVHISAQISPK